MTAAHEPARDRRGAAPPAVRDSARTAPESRHPSTLGDVVAALRSGLPLPGPAALSALILIAALLWLPPGLRTLLFVLAGGVAGATALPFAVVGLGRRLLDLLLDRWHLDRRHIDRRGGPK